MDLWPIDWPTEVDKTTLDPLVVQWAELAAANAMRFLTLYRVGGSPITVRPCGSTCRNPHYYQVQFDSGAGFHPYLADNGMYANCFCASGCGCSDPAGIRLDGPVGDVTRVTVDGVVVAPGEYHVINDSTLVRTVGSFPACSNRVEVTYLNAHKVDIQGQYAAGVLAYEFYKARTNAKGCRLPSNITNISRSGVTMQFQTGMFPDMLTGIKEVDTYLVLWNPNGLRQATKVFSLDQPQAWVKTWG